MHDGYHCKECGASVTIADGLPVRTCGHDGTIVAEMKATAYGEGGAASTNPVMRLINKVLMQLRGRKL